MSQLGDIISDDFSQQLSHLGLQFQHEAAVKAFVKLVDKSWIDPPSQGQTDLVSLSTLVMIPPDIAMQYDRSRLSV